MRSLRHLFPVRRVLAAPFVSAVALALVLTGCGSSDDPAADGKPVVHASGPVWASVAQAVAGDDATVTSTQMSSSQDPHSYEPSAQDKLAFSKADVIVLNGGHYDEWAEELVTSLSKQSAVLNATDLAEEGHDHDHEGDETSSESPDASGSADDHGDEGHGDDEHSHDHSNEHVFQSIPAAEAMAEALGERLAQLDPAHAETYRANAKTFSESIHKQLSDAQAALAPHEGAKVLATEAVSSLLVADLGLTDVTPEAYVEQSETDDGPSVAVLAEAEKLVRSGNVKVLLVNAQTGDSASAALEQAAREAGVPIVQVHETLPEGVTTYAAYMALHIDAITKALG